jgi:hypothetical protein
VDKPSSWFITTVSRLQLYGIIREQTRNDYLVVAPKEAIRLVLDIMEKSPDGHAYTALKERLLGV